MAVRRGIARLAASILGVAVVLEARAVPNAGEDLSRGTGSLLPHCRRHEALPFRGRLRVGHTHHM